jgi:hypothetical protein
MVEAEDRAADQQSNRAAVNRSNDLENILSLLI